MREQLLKDVKPTLDGGEDKSANGYQLKLDLQCSMGNN